MAKGAAMAKKAAKTICYLQKNKDCTGRCSPYSIISLLIRVLCL